MSTRDFFHLDADVGTDEDEDFDEETGEPVKKTKTNGATNNLDDSSEEEDDDDDEEAAKAVREGFIVDEDEEEQEQRRKRKRRDREERIEEGLDDEDLDLIGALPDETTQESRFKRLKRGTEQRGPRGVDEIFSEENEDERDEFDRPGRNAQPMAGEFDDFIEEDDPDMQDGDALDDVEVTRRTNILGAIDGLQAAGLDEAGAEDMRAAFGDGNEYNWALELQEAMDDEELDPDKPLELKDVFEPSQLAEKMLTDDDKIIKSTDVPERFQLARKSMPEELLTDEEQEERFNEESSWITKLLAPKKHLDPAMIEPLRKGIASVLSFMNVENLEVPFIFQHRKDYLIHAARIHKSPDPRNPDAPEYEIRAQKLLNQSDLWEIFELDLKFRALVEKRKALQRTYTKIQDITSSQDAVVETMMPIAMSMEEVQDIQDYVQFQYSAELKDIALRSDSNGGLKRTRGSGGGIFEQMRASTAYNVVRGFGVTPDKFAQSVLEESRGGHTDDPAERPDDMADKYVNAEEFSTGAQILRTAKAMFAEEIAMSPRMRQLMRKTYYMQGQFDCIRTEKGLKKIGEDHPYYEFKYMRNQSLVAIARRPELFLRMLKAEQEGLIDVKLRLNRQDSFRRQLQRHLQSDNLSEVADAWNTARKESLDIALQKLERIMVKGVKENLKTECENTVARTCRDEFYSKLDQAPYASKAMEAGTKPQVMTFTPGNEPNTRNSVFWTFLNAEGRMQENGRLADFQLGIEDKGLPDSEDVDKIVQVIDRRKPDIIGVSGFSVEARKLYTDLRDLIERKDIRGIEYDDPTDSRPRRDLIEVAMVNDEVARLYHTSKRATLDYPSVAPLTKYCVGLGKYLQSPLKQYAALGRDILSISFNPDQNLIPEDKLMKYLETSLVDIVNMNGVDVKDALSDPYTANLLPYVSGLGPRKANAMLAAINKNGNKLTTREELVGDPENDKVQACSAVIFQNCASFLHIEWDSNEYSSNPLDATRIHPEDYELAKKMASDAMELDEEDILAEVDDHGDYAIVKKLMRDGVEEKVNDLILELYAEQLETEFKSKKRATLETIRAEIITPYEELRGHFQMPTSDEVFTMLTGETRDSLCEGMIVPIQIKKAFQDRIECRLDCGIDGAVQESEFPSGVGENGVEPRHAYQPRQTVQAKLLFLNRKGLQATLTLRESQLERGYRKDIERDPGEWDDAQEDSDRREALKRTEEVAGRAQRVIKHPLFRPFNSAQAEEFLGPQGRGDVVIRPSSKGPDHLAVTWKVSDNVFQHIDVLELDKENEFSVGKTLKIGGKYTYSDLDELIVNHIKGMAKKVDEIMTDERYNSGSRAQTGKHCLQARDLLLTYHRTMAISLCRGEPKTCRVRLLHQPRVSWVFHNVLQAGTQCQTTELACQDHSECI